MKLFILANTFLFFFIPILKIDKKTDSTTIQKTEQIQTTNAILATTNNTISIDTIVHKDASPTLNQEEKKSGSGLLLLSGLAIALSSLGLMHANKKKSTRLTRWAKANATKAQVAIASTQIGMAALSFYAGHNLHMLGYEVSTKLHYVFPAIAALGFLTVPYIAKKETMVLPKTLAKRKLGFLAIALASLLNVATLGNHFVQEHSNNIVATSLQSIDETIIGEQSNYSEITNQKENNTIETHQSNTRKAVSVGLGILLTLAFILLLVTLCAGICMIAFALTAATIEFSLLLGGVALSIGSVWGMAEIIKKASKKK